MKTVLIHECFFLFNFFVRCISDHSIADDGSYDFTQLLLLMPRFVCWIRKGYKEERSKEKKGISSLSGCDLN
jgi:hypothetical protein